MPTDYVEKTRERLQNRPSNLTLYEISKKTDISISWLSKFSSGTMDNPRVKTLITLNEFLDRIA